MSRLLFLVPLLAACAHAASSAPTSASGSAVSSSSSKTATTTLRQDSGGSIAVWTPVQGARDAAITVVEFSDFQCPFCARAEATVKALREQYGVRLRVAFRNLPLPFHALAARAAEAAMAANAQGKFWEMHDQLFANSARLSEEAIASAARAAGLDLAAFDRAMREHTYAKQVTDDAALAKSIGAVGTPTFFVNGRKIAGAQPIAAFREAIDAELKIADALVAAGAPREHLYDVRLATADEAARPAPEEEHHDDPDQTSPRRATLAAWTPVRGSRPAKVTIVEYSDFECPFCARAAVTIDALRAKYGHDLRVAYRHNPLPFHPHARAFAELSMAAQEQGKFWEVHDYLFAHGEDLGGLDADVDRADYVARAVGLDMKRYKKSMAAHAHAREIDGDIAEALHLGARGTPTFFVNGQIVMGAQPVEKFVQVIDAERKKAQELLDRGVAPQDLYEKTLAALPDH